MKRAVVDQKKNQTDFHLNVIRVSKAVVVSSEAAVKNILSFFVVSLFFLKFLLFLAGR